MATSKFDTLVSMITTSRSTTSTSYTVTEDRKPIWHYDADAFTDITAVYIELNGRVDAAATGTIGLHDDAGTLVTGAEATTTQVGVPNTRSRSGDILANLVDGTDYHIKYKTSASTFRIDSAKIVIVQNGTITKTEINVEMGDLLNVTNTYFESASGTYWVYTASEYSPTPTFYFEMTAKCSNSARTVYAHLWDATAAAEVASSEVTHTGDTTTTRKRSTAITLVDGHRYYMEAKCDSGSSEDINCTRIIIQQSSTLVKTTLYNIVLNTTTSGTGTSYANQGRDLLFDGSTGYVGSSIIYYYEGTLYMSTGVETGYYQLYNNTDTAQIGEFTTTSSTKIRVRTSSLTLPSDDGNNLDGGRKVSVGAETVSVNRSYLVISITVSSSARTGNFMLMGVGN